LGAVADAAECLGSLAAGRRVGEAGKAVSLENDTWADAGLRLVVRKADWRAEPRTVAGGCDCGAAVTAAVEGPRNATRPSSMSGTSTEHDDALEADTHDSGLS